MLLSKTKGRTWIEEGERGDALPCGRGAVTMGRRHGSDLSGLWPGKRRKTSSRSPLPRPRTHRLSRCLAMDGGGETEGRQRRGQARQALTAAATGRSATMARARGKQRAARRFGRRRRETTARAEGARLGAAHAHACAAHGQSGGEGERERESRGGRGRWAERDSAH